MLANEVITYQCVDPHHKVTGTTSRTTNITCGATGRWNTGGWPACRTQCVVPTPAQVRSSKGGMFREGRNTPHMIHLIVIAEDILSTILCQYECNSPHNVRTSILLQRCPLPPTCLRHARDFHWKARMLASVIIPDPARPRWTNGTVA